MGNVFLSEAKEVLHTGYSGDPTKLNVSVPWQYVYNNGQGSLFFGYAWSLDTFVDYSWHNMLSLGRVIIILAVVEVVLIQLSCIVYEFFLLQKCNVSHMRLFSVFLALPSATIRLMAQRQLQVDDNAGDALDDDDDDLDLEPAAATAADLTAAANTAEADKKKSVRLAAGLDDEAEEQAPESDKGRTHRSKKEKPANKSQKCQASAKGSATAASSRNSKEGNKHHHKHGGAFSRLFKLAFGWVDPTFKANGKKLVTHSNTLWTMMGPLCLCMVTVAVIYGVSYAQLKKLQGPLVSLDVAIHVQYQLGRCRLAANAVAYSDSHAISDKYKAQLKVELQLLQQEYDTLVFGGPMRLMVSNETLYL
eukprot:GHUV01035610.1.p1 GENE.GHUV01035610.1~~GHUV01035610.1.p1  ORF type:complete len:363 (+),score=121.72 GHUV01035610.1:211-1299(+)